jgi:hypothetical protein
MRSPFRPRAGYSRSYSSPTMHSSGDAGCPIMPPAPSDGSPVRPPSPMTEICAIRPPRIPGRLQASCFMRSWFARCLILLLSLALASGNAHAALHLTAAHSEPCPEEHVHHTGKTLPHHQHQHDNGLACCCDCLGCTSAAYLPPELGITPTELPARVCYDAFTASLSGQTLLPEPGPPRPDTLS